MNPQNPQKEPQSTSSAIISPPTISRIRILLYVPNLIGYLRLLLLSVSFCYCFSSYRAFLALYIISYSLDAVDGTVARRLNQCTRFGAVLDMLVDRVAKNALLLILGHLQPAWFVYYMGMAFLDLVSHWCQMYASVLGGATSHKAELRDENFLVAFYYKFPGMLFVCVFGAEAYACGNYLVHFKPEVIEESMLLRLTIAAATIVFYFKQLICVIQLCSSLCGILDFDRQEVLKKAS